MRATAITDHGADPALLELDTPEPDEGEVRVKVHAASVNGFDVAVTKGWFAQMMEHRFPVVLGKDFAGTVDAVGPGVDDYAIGDRVFGVVTKPYLGDGSFSEQVTVPVAVGLARLPDGVTFAEGAALGLAGAAAVAAVDAADPQPGQTVLVVGATGGVGNQVVQLAAAAGATVVATAHTDEERRLVTDLGATEVVDPTEDVVHAVLDSRAAGVDTVIHLAGDPTPLLAAVRHGGRFVSTLLVSPADLPSDRADVVAIYANPEPALLDRLAANQAEGRTRVTVQRTYPLDDAAQALRDFAQGTLGKLVLTAD